MTACISNDSGNSGTSTAGTTVATGTTTTDKNSSSNSPTTGNSGDSETAPATGNNSSSSLSTMGNSGATGTNQATGNNNSSPTPQETLISVTVQKLPDSGNATVTQYEQGVKMLLVSGKKLDLAAPTETFSSKNLPSDNRDTGMNILKSNSDAINKGHGGVKHFKKGNVGIYLRDNELNGWKYQSFGRYYSEDGSQYGFVSVGETTKSLPTKQGEITYRGIAMGDSSADDVVGSGELVADTTLKVNFDTKQLTFNTNMTKGYDGSEVVDYASYNLSGTSTLNEKSSAFNGEVRAADGSSGTFKGSFYGNDASEIGGTFDLKGNNHSYIGGFGAKEVTK
ncbi:transferrin-binding protein-like solute binding protein [Ursidibacter sp. B-7004-1]